MRHSGIPRAARRRAQAEIIGLTLIVVLLAIGFLLYVKYSLSGADSVRESYEETNLGQSFLNSVVKADVKCGDLSFTVEKHLQMIASGSERCPSDPTKASKAVVERHLEDVLEKTLDLWGINYRLVIVEMDVNTRRELRTLGIANLTNRQILPATERCNATMDRSTDHYVVQVPPTYTKSVELRLERCG